MVTHPSTPWALVLAGGDGTRLRELATMLTGRPTPKQYCRILGDRSLLESTLDRVAPLASPERTVVVVNHDHLPYAREQLTAVPTPNVLVQPANRETGPGLLFALLQVARRDPDATVAVFPSDHFVAQPDVFGGHVERARAFVERNPSKVALLGISPTHAETGYGYIQPGDVLDPSSGIRGVARFQEKPDATTALNLVEAGGLWNAFVMVFKVRRVLELIARVRPADFVALACLSDSRHLARRYRTLTPWNFSSDFLTHVTEHLAVVRADETGWTDWGTRESIERTFAELSLVPPWQRAGSPREVADTARLALVA